MSVPSMVLPVGAASMVVAGYFDAGFGRFLVSPGFGGAAALVAALLAYVATRQRLSVDREVSRQERWWATLTWIYDRATHENLNQRLTPGLALDLFDRLLDEAHTELEIRTVTGLLEGLFVDSE